MEKLCKLKRQIAKLEEKTEFFEEHSLQLTEDIKKKSKYALPTRIWFEVPGLVGSVSLKAKAVARSLDA